MENSQIWKEVAKEEINTTKPSLYDLANLFLSYMSQSKLRRGHEKNL